MCSCWMAKELLLRESILRWETVKWPQVPSRGQIAQSCLRTTEDRTTAISKACEGKVAKTMESFQAFATLKSSTFPVLRSMTIPAWIANVAMPQWIGQECSECSESLPTAGHSRPTLLRPIERQRQQIGRQKDGNDGWKIACPKYGGFWAAEMEHSRATKDGHAQWIGVEGGLKRGGCQSKRLLMVLCTFRHRF